MQINDKWLKNQHKSDKFINAILSKVLKVCFVFCIFFLQIYLLAGPPSKRVLCVFR